MNIHFPVTYSILSVRVLISDILPDYSLGDIADCKFYMPGFNDTNNEDAGHLASLSFPENIS